MITLGNLFDPAEEYSISRQLHPVSVYYACAVAVPLVESDGTDECMEFMQLGDG